MNMVTMMASYGARLCPERAAAAIVKRIGKPPSSFQDSPILTVTVNGHLKQVTSTHMINALQDAVGAIGQVKQGIKKRTLEHTWLDQAGPWQCTLENAPFHDHANWMLVQQFLPQVHQKAGNGIQPKCGNEDVIMPEFQAHPRHLHEGPTR